MGLELVGMFLAAWDSSNVHTEGIFSVSLFRADCADMCQNLRALRTSRISARRRKSLATKIGTR